ncbi:MAG: nucleoside hydrolase [Capsulimonadaceae bacterium]
MDQKLSTLSDSERIALLTPPVGRVRMVLDTDTFNEIDDQFALVYAMLSTERLDVEGVYAAPFHNSRSTGPRDGMEKSYEEICRVLDRLGRDPDNLVYRGSSRWLGSPESPVESAAALDLVERARESSTGPLYVVAIGAITNVASALLLAPDIADKVVVVWLGGHPHTWHTAPDFNVRQDMAASRLLLDCGVPLVRVPCVNVAEHLRTTLPELERYVQGRGMIGDYLYDIFASYWEDHTARSKVIWDIAPIAWLLDAHWIPSVILPAPILTDQHTWSLDPRRPLMREAIGANRDAVFGDLFRKLGPLNVAGARPSGRALI